VPWVFAFAYFVDRPEQAKWLTGPDRQTLMQEADPPAAPAKMAILPLLRDPRVLACALCWFCVMTGG
jgi:hypothetical protein